jgi:Asp-tRNA(Asn)/Glu-tRNA(Gln) amidotransferase A subunit family amidase
MKEERHPHRPPGGAGPAGAFVVGPGLLARGVADGPLSGQRFATKDLLDVAGARTGAGNPAFLADAPVATEHAAPVAALLAAGADLVGKTVTDELAFSLSGTNVHYGTPPNPAAPDRVPGGSSSGSASAVASGQVDLALGTDTGGSVRVPSSYCGIYGIRPSHGRISRRGVFLLAPSFCTVGLFARQGPMLAAGWQALVSGATDPGWSERPSRPVGGLAVVPELSALADPSAAPGIARALRDLARRLGVPLSEATLGGPAAIERYLAAFRTLQMAEAWQRHGSWISAQSRDLGPGIAARFAAAAHVTVGEADEANAVRGELRAVLEAQLGADLYLVQPTASGAAPPIGLEGPLKDDLRLRTLELTAPAGLAGSPVVSLPLADDDDLPVGLALVGLPGDDETLVACAARTVPGRA